MNGYGCCEPGTRTRWFVGIRLMRSRWRVLLGIINRGSVIRLMILRPTFVNNIRALRKRRNAAIICLDIFIFCFVF